MRFRNLDNSDVKGKRVLLRVDLNVPMQEGKILDSTRIEEVAPTIIELSDKGGKVILLSHLGRPKGTRSEEPRCDRSPPRWRRIVKRPVSLPRIAWVRRRKPRLPPWKNGDILCLENTRFIPRRKKRQNIRKTTCGIGRHIRRRCFLGRTP